MGLQPAEGLSFSCIAVFTPSLRDRFKQTHQANTHFLLQSQASRGCACYDGGWLMRS
jgi:hypothetical protein